MYDLRMFDFDFNLLDIENKILSANWKIYYNKIGTAEIHLPITSAIVPILFDNQYLIITQGDLQAIVTAKQIGQECIIYGKTPNWILSRRTVPYFSEVTGPAETLVCGLVEEAFSDVNNFILGNTAGVTSEITIVEDSYCALSDVIKDALDMCKAGHRVVLDIIAKQWKFEVLSGISRNVVISKANLNASDMEYMYDLQDYFTEGFFQRELTKMEIDNDSPPIWENIKNIEKSGIYRWTTRLSSRYESDALRELLENKISDEITAKIRKLSRGTDYNLGDIVKLQIEKGELKRTKEYVITGVNVWSESNDSGQQPIFEEK